MNTKSVRIAVIAAAFFALMAATARGQETGARDEQGLKLSLRPAKVQLFVGTGAVIVSGDTIAEVDLAGVATIHPIGKGLFLRPYLAVGEVDPAKAGADNFGNAQLGLLLGYKVNQRFAVLAGGSVTALFPESGTQYRETLNVATATTILKSDHGVLQFMTPISFNKAPNGDLNVTAVAALGWTF